jgi:hypothetical protein
MLSSRGRIWDIVESKNNYRLTLVSVQPTYYVFEAELLAVNVKFSAFSWLPRSMPRRINKELFHQLLLLNKFNKVKPF